MSFWFTFGSWKAPDFNGPVDVPFQAFLPAWLETPLMELFQRSAVAHPDHIALAGPGVSLSYSAMLERVLALAGRIAAFEDDAPVAILLAQDLRFPIAALACLAAGRPYIPVDPRYPAARVSAILEDAGASLALVAAGQGGSLLPNGFAALAMDGTGQVDAALPCAPLPPPLAVDAPAIILYTSGSTGQPKGICNSQRALLQRVGEATNASHLNDKDSFLLLSSPGTIAGEREIFAGLLAGARLAFADPQRDGLHGVLRMFAHYKVTVCYLVPSLMRMLWRSPGAAQALSTLRVLRIGGDITLSSDLALFRQVAPADCHFLASFSATEMPALFQWFVPRDWQPDGPRVPVGYPRPESELALVDEDGEPASGEDFAELVVKSRYLALGLWQKGRLQAGPFRVAEDDPSQRILHSGDMLRPRPDGLWDLAGRRDRQLKINGRRIDTGEVESLLRGYPEVDDVAVLVRRQGEQAVALVAFVASAQAHARLVDDLRAMLAERLPQYMCPAQIWRLPAIPQLPGFKPDMTALQRLDEQFMATQQRARDVATPLSSAAAQAEHGSGDAHLDPSVQAAVKAAWSRVLGAQTWRMDLPFDQSGGDSLKALELWFHIEEALGFRLGLDAMRHGSRPSELVSALSRAIAQPGRMSELDANDASPLIYLMPGILGDDPMQLRFRGAFGKQVRFRLLDYPSWRDTMQHDCSFDALVDAVFRQVMDDPPRESYFLAGYSYGGIVAFELARRLVQAGRRVEMLALLDTRRWDLADTRPIWQPDEMLPETGLVSRALAATITLMVRMRLYLALSVSCSMLTRFAHRLAFRFRNRMTKDLRFEALRKWRPVYLPVPMTLYVSNSRWPGEPEGYGWQDLSSTLEVVYIGGTHATVIDRPGREMIAVHIQHALRSRSGALAA